jgi:hypothetical protein
MLAGVLCIGCGVGLVLGIVYTARFWNRFLASRDGPAAFLLTPTSAWWDLYGGFAGICVTWFIAAPIMRAMMGSGQFDQWMIQGNRRAGFDSPRALRLLAFVIMVPYTVLFLPSLVCHTRFSESEVGIQGYAEIHEKRYPYSDVEKAAIVNGYRDRSGTFRKDRRVVLYFRDGRRWSSRDSFRDPEEIRSDLTAFISQKTSLKFQIVDLEAESR